MNDEYEPLLKKLDDLAGRIRLHIQSDKRPVLFVEGIKDKRLLRKLSNDGVAIFPCGNRNGVFGSVAKVGDLAHPLAGIVDRDFDDFPAEGTERVFPYENADQEAMLSCIEAVDEILEEYGSSTKIARAGGAQEIDSKIQESTRVLARLRRANFENNWGIAFDKVDLAGKYDARTFSLRIRPLCDALNSTSGGSPGTQVLVEYAEGRREVRNPSACPRLEGRYFRGRDYLTILSALLNRALGTRSKANVSVENLESSLRIAGSANPAATRWFTDLAGNLRETEATSR